VIKCKSPHQHSDSIFMKILQRIHDGRISAPSFMVQQTNFAFPKNVFVIALDGVAVRFASVR